MNHYFSESDGDKHKHMDEIHPSWATPTLENQRVFPGDRLFELKATFGLPLDVAIERILKEPGVVIDWLGFVETARKNRWYDFQTIEVLEVAIVDAGLSRDYVKTILTRVKAYMLEHTLVEVID